MRRGDWRTCGRHVKWPAVEQGCSDSGRRLDLERWRLIFVGPQYQTCFMSPFWRLEFRGDLVGVWKICAFHLLRFNRSGAALWQMSAVVVFIDIGARMSLISFT